MRGASEADRSQYVGDVLSVENGWARVDVKNRFAVGDRIEVMHPCGNRDITITRMLSDAGEDISVAPGSGHFVRIELDGVAGAGLAGKVSVSRQLIDTSNTELAGGATLWTCRLHHSGSQVLQAIFDATQHVKMSSSKNP